LKVEKENDSDEVNDDGEEKKDQEKLLEDVSEKPSVVRSFAIEYVLITHADTVGQRG